VFPAVYTVPLVGDAVKLADVLYATKYSSAVVAVNEPERLVLVGLPKANPLGEFAGVAHKVDN
jgi:hypothetical protein